MIAGETRQHWVSEPGDDPRAAWGCRMERAKPRGHWTVVNDWGVTGHVIGSERAAIQAIHVRM